MRRALGLILKAVARPAGTRAGGVATLNHEVRNHAMEDRSVVELVRRLLARGGVRPLLRALGEFNEVSYGDGCVGFEEADGDLAFGRIEDGVSSWCERHRNS